MNADRVINVILIGVIIVLLFSLAGAQDNFFDEDLQTDVIEQYWLPITAPEGENVRCYGRAWKDNSIFGGGALILYTGNSTAFVCIPQE